MTTTSKPELHDGHYCYYVPEQDTNEYGGYVPSLVVEHTAGHYPMLGNGPCAMPWVWGDTLERAREVADVMNERLGVSPSRAAVIVASSMTKFAERSTR